MVERADVFELAEQASELPFTSLGVGLDHKMQVPYQTRAVLRRVYTVC
jgi:hypothetical protein